MNFFKQAVALILALALGFYVVPDADSLKLYLFRLDMVVVICLVALLVIGPVEGWGLIPDFSLTKLVRKGREESQAAAMQLLAGSLFLSVVLLLVIVG